MIDLQLVAFPQQGILGFDGGRELMRKAVELGADVVGGIPHYELTREDGVESVRFAMALADEHGLRVDIHCDETDDDQSRFVEVMAAETIRRGMSGRVTASHTTAMHSYNSAYAYRLIRNIARAGLHMVTNPLDNSVLQGRFDTGPIRRGHTRVKELQEAGVNVCIGHDSVMDPWYPLGYGDPLQAAFVLVHLGQMSGDSELRRLIEMITVNPAAALGVPDYGLRDGGPADLVVFDAPSEADALRLIAPRTLVLRGGKVIARAARPSTPWSGRAPRSPSPSSRWVTALPATDQRPAPFLAAGLAVSPGITSSSWTLLSPCSRKNSAVQQRGQHEADLEGQVAEGTDGAWAPCRRIRGCRSGWRTSRSTRPLETAIATKPAHGLCLRSNSRPSTCLPRRRNWSAKNTPSHGPIQYAMTSRKLLYLTSRRR